jgi:hypothetical protein
VLRSGKTHSAVTIAWNAVAGAAGYEIIIKQHDTGVISALTQVPQYLRIIGSCACANFRPRAACSSGGTRERICAANLFLSEARANRLALFRGQIWCHRSTISTTRRWSLSFQVSCSQAT